MSAIIARSAWKLIRTTLGRDRLPWVLFSALAVLLKFKKLPEPVLIFAAGMAGLLLFRGGH